MESCDYAKFSIIAKSATLQPHATLEHPVHMGPQTEIHNGSSLGRCSYLNIKSVIYPNVKIGRYCSVARNCEIGVAAHPTHFLSTHSFQYNSALFPNWPEYKDMERKAKFLAHRPTIIGDDVWIGAQAIVVAGVRIGDGAVVAANSVVTKDVEPYSIVGGSPAKTIRFRFRPDQIKDLQSLKWWDLSLSELSVVRFDDIELAITDLKHIRAQKNAELVDQGFLNSSSRAS
uniref:CatB-related O-acetyltransferase n=1 Tax=Cupriavidus taiwanensis TaxID=164546 RepID=UPI000E1FDBB5|nr:CatB-related O-acetyltransferase [Cupriavidus taiwanensis]